MQINNNNHNQSFTALKIRPKARKALENTSKEFINKLNCIGEELKDTKYYNMEIDENLCPHVYADHGGKYRPPFSVLAPKNNAGGRLVQIAGTWDGATDVYRSENRYHQKINGARYIHNIEMDNSSAANAVYEKFNTLDSTYDKAAYVTRLLDNEEKNKKIWAPNIVDQDDIKKGVNNLLKKFGIRVNI
jgi:hypothetical protein